MRQTISCTIVVCNEERNIRDCLELAKWMDEIVVVDAFSQDKTVQLCREYTPRIYQRPWNGFGEQKNYAIDHAACDWVFILDADERISAQLREEIERILSSDAPDGPVAYYLPTKELLLWQVDSLGRMLPRLPVAAFSEGSGTPER